MFRSANVYFIFIAMCLLWGCTRQSPIDENSVKQDILKVLNNQEQAWNAFNIERFMQGYVRSDSLRFAGGDTVYYGWQTTLERYQRTYPDPSAMGRLTFSRISVRIISREAAMVFGRYTLERENDMPTGLFTLLFKQIERNWKIVHDHTSSAQE